MIRIHKSLLPCIKPNDWNESKNNKKRLESHQVTSLKTENCAHLVNNQRFLNLNKLFTK